MAVLTPERSAAPVEPTPAAARPAPALATRFAGALRPRVLADRRRALLIAAVLGVGSLALRVVGIGFPRELIFDEAYYPVHARDLLELGSEYNRGYTYIVHPPLGKWLIALGELVFGQNSVGWRVPSAVAGAICVVLLFWIARRLSGSTLLGAIAGLLLAFDAFSFVLGRTGLLDIFLPMFVLAGFACLLVDRDRVRSRLADLVGSGELTERARLGFRSWRVAAGVLFGAACAVKWSGIWFLAAFAILSVLWDRSAFRAAGLRRPTLVTLRRVLPASLGTLGLLPIVAYVASFAGWFAGENSQQRHWAEANPDTAFPFIPGALRSLWHMHAEWLEFHNGLTGSHPWESQPWSWLVTGRPVLFFYEGRTTADGSQSIREILLAGTPVLWFAFVPAVVWLVWLAVSRLDWRAVAVLAGIAAGWLTWFVNLERTMFLFYMAPVVPFFILAVTLALGSALGRANDSELRRQIGLVLVSMFVALVIVNFFFLHPILVGDPLTPEQVNLRKLFPSW